MAGQSADKATAGLDTGGRTGVTVAVDLGQSKVACFLMKKEGVRHADRSIRVAGAGHVKSLGVRAGGIVNPEEAAQAIGQAVERAERAAKAQVSGVIVSTSIGQMRSHRQHARVSLGANPVGDGDLARAIALALAELRLPDRRPIHVLPIQWSIDGQGGVQDPRGLKGHALGLDLLVVSMAESAFHALSHSVERAFLDLQGVVAAPVVSSLAALRDDEMELGCTCIDMGAGVTSAAVWGGRALLHVDSINIGGDHVTADIARGLLTSSVGAERLKTLHGSAMASANEDREELEAPARGDDPHAAPVIIPRAMLKTIIAPRVEETLEILRDRLRAAGVGLEPGAGLVLTGGASQLNGVSELAERVFNRPVRLGRPIRAPHLADAASGPAYCAAAGVLHRAAFGPRESVSARKLMGARPITAADAPKTHKQGVVSRGLHWLKENL